MHAFVTNLNGQIVDLGTLKTYSEGRGINDKGQVVGFSYDQGFTPDGPVSNAIAFIADNGTLLDLNTLLDNSATGWELIVANDINDAGLITGAGYHNGLLRAFLMTPVPAPAAFWLMGSNLLGLLGLSSRSLSEYDKK